MELKRANASLIIRKEHAMQSHLLCESFVKKAAYFGMHLSQRATTFYGEEIPFEEIFFFFFGHNFGFDSGFAISAAEDTQLLHCLLEAITRTLPRGDTVHKLQTSPMLPPNHLPNATNAKTELSIFIQLHTPSPVNINSAPLSPGRHSK
jgi:hypothetical protein